MAQEMIEFTDLIKYVLDYLPELILEKVDEDELKLFFEAELTQIKKKKLVIPGIIMNCEDETEDLNYSIRYQLVQNDIYLTEEETEIILELEKQYYEELYAFPKISYHLEHSLFF